MKSQHQQYFRANKIEAVALKAVPFEYACQQNITDFKEIITAQLSGNIILPHAFGLPSDKYQTLLNLLDDNDLFNLELLWHQDESDMIRERALLCEKLFSFKEEEREELITLLCSYRNEDEPSSLEMAMLIACACLTNSHLWSSLGLSDRSQLGALIKYNFPKLHALNTENMRWKRFFYRQLCQQGGDFICKAPSCGECKSYAECFA
ncbi:nitrogen fixation protein NifQ [Psychromonas sp. KJ10-10]|uniref:nitrogen fixation protein NifQ n=1 Tax=Psychromonas sp. KJ10-10 TaxID=3391823 RepID=UPI0039B413FD